LDAFLNHHWQYMSVDQRLAALLGHFHSLRFNVQLTAS
jgi:hypothetical protein